MRAPASWKKASSLMEKQDIEVLLPSQMRRVRSFLDRSNKKML